MHDFYSVTFRNGCRVPIRAADDLLIDFNRYSLRVQIKCFDEIMNAGAFGNSDLISINDDRQLNLPPLGLTLVESGF